MVPVSGPFVTTLNLPADVASVPVTGPVANISLFSGLKGSTFGSTSSIKYLLPKPLAPRNFSAQSILKGSVVIFLVDKLHAIPCPCNQTSFAHLQDYLGKLGRKFLLLLGLWHLPARIPKP